MPAWKDMTPEQREARITAMKAGRTAAKDKPKPERVSAPKPSTSEPVMVTLSAEEIAEIRAQAIADLAKQKKKELIAAELIRQKRLVAESMGMPVEPEPEEPEEFSFMPQLAEYASHIRIDGKYYYHGVMYHGLTKLQYDTLRNIEAQTWIHQATIDGKRQNYYNQNSRLWQQADGGSPRGASRHVI